MWSGMVKKLALIIASVFTALVCCEFGVRFMVKDWPFERELARQTHMSQNDQTLRWRFSSSRTRNSLGLRNREIGPKEPESYRILFLGDSLIFSGETSNGRLYTEVLEHRLNSRASRSKIHYEVINAGVPGYTTYQELQFLKIYGLDMNPDLLILGFVLNDVHYKYLHKPTEERMLDMDPSYHLTYFDTKKFPGNIIGKSHLAHEIALRSKILINRIHNKPVFPFELRGDFHLAWKEYAWSHVQDLILEMHDILGHNGIRFAVIVFPVSDQMNIEYRSANMEYLFYPQRMIRKICNQNGIPILDLANTVFNKGGTTLYKDYLHLNPTGNDVVCDEIEKYLLDDIDIMDIAYIE